MQNFPTRMCNVTAWRHTGLRSHWLMTLVAGGWGGIPRELQRLLSLFIYGSTGGVCGRSLTVGIILFTGGQTCSLYLVLWLCGIYVAIPYQGFVRKARIFEFTVCGRQFIKKDQFRIIHFIDQLNLVYASTMHREKNRVLLT